jgi:hypothetical protein
LDRVGMTLVSPARAQDPSSRRKPGPKPCVKFSGSVGQGLRGLKIRVVDVQGAVLDSGFRRNDGGAVPG